MAISESSKHIVQIIQLLEERSMCFSFCLNKADVLVLSGMTLLYQTLDLKQDSMMMKDGERLINAVIKITDRIKAPGCYDFKRVAAMLVTVDELTPPPSSLPTPPSQSPDHCMAAPPARASPPAQMPQKKVQPYALGRHTSASMSETDLLAQQEKIRRMTMPQMPVGRPELHRSHSRSSFDNVRPEMPIARRDHRLSVSQAQMLARVSPQQKTPQRQSLDYLTLGGAAGQSQPSSPIQARLQQQHIVTSAPQAQIYATAQLSQKVAGVTTQEWDALLGSLDTSQMNVYDMYGGSGLSLTETPVSTTSMSAGAWSPDSWDLSGFNIGDIANNPGPAQSVLSLSDESLSSAGEEMTASELGIGVNNLDYRNAMLPTATPDGFILEGLDSTYGL